MEANQKNFLSKDSIFINMPLGILKMDKKYKGIEVSEDLRTVSRPPYERNLFFQLLSRSWILSTIGFHRPFLQGLPVGNPRYLKDSKVM